jgi:hypothetical protein
LRRSGCRAVVAELGRLILDEWVVDKDEGRLALGKLSFKPLQLLFAKGADVGIEVGGAAVLSAAEKIVQMDELVTLIVEDRIGVGVELGLEKTMTHLAGDMADVVVVIAEAEMDGHLESVGDGLGVIQASGVLEVEVVVGGWVVVEVIADEKDLLDGGMERVDEIACRGEAGRGDQNALVVLHAVLAALT